MNKIELCKLTQIGDTFTYNGEAPYTFEGEISPHYYATDQQITEEEYRKATTITITSKVKPKPKQMERFISYFLPKKKRLPRKLKKRIKLDVYGKKKRWYFYKPEIGHKREKGFDYQFNRLFLNNFAAGNYQKRKQNRTTKYKYL